MAIVCSRLLGHGLMDALLAFWVCTPAAASTSGARSSAASEIRKDPIVIDLGPTALAERDAVELLFSTNGVVLCAWWQDWKVVKTNQGYLRQGPEFRVFDLAGVLLCSSKDADHSLMWSNFPSIAWRETQSTFVTNTEGFLFGPAYSWGLRTIEQSLLGDVRVECWSLPITPGDQPLWTRELKKAFSCRPIATLDTAGDQVLLVMLIGKALVLSRKTGETIREFTIGHVETDEEAAARNRRLGLRLLPGDPACRFSPHTFSYDHNQHYLAAGAFFDKRLRVVDVFQPDRVVFEAYTGVHPARPWGGIWRVQSVHFAGEGKYLIARYNFDGRGTKTSIHSIEIYETSNWKCVWKEDDPTIGSVTLSPNGRLLAFAQNKTIKIIPFQPQK